MPRQADYVKNNGIFYTPQELADCVSALAIQNSKSTLLDPCYGEGALLIAAHKRLVELGSKYPQKQLFGYDIAPPEEGFRPNKLHRLVNKQNLEAMDFFSLNGQETEAKFDVILMNPPFVRHHLIRKGARQKIENVIGDNVKLPKSSDLWAYFLIHSFKFIQKNGTLAAILPWSFLRAEFAKRVRELLLERFRLLRVVVIGQRMFERAGERILVVLGNDFGSSSEDIGIKFSRCVPQKQVRCVPAERNIWTTSPWTCLVSRRIHKLMSNVRGRLGFRPLSSFAKVRIGTVTGANKFFILKRDVARRMRLPQKILQSIIANSRDLCTLTIFASEDVKDRLILIPEDLKLTSALERYVRKGEMTGLDKRYHTRNRAKWYSIPYQEAPDGFLHYMTKEVPFIVLNPDRLWSTNTVHQVFFEDGLDENTIKWIQFSMFTSISQLSIELLGRTYGGGVLKIEPSAATGIVVYPGMGNRFPRFIEDKLNRLLIKGDRREAMEFADKWIATNLDMPVDDMESIIRSYAKMRDLRQGKNFGKTGVCP